MTNLQILSRCQTNPIWAFEALTLGYTGCKGGEQHEDSERRDQENEAAEEGGAVQEEETALSALPQGCKALQQSSDVSPTRCSP